MLNAVTPGPNLRLTLSADQANWSLQTAEGVSSDGSVVGWGSHYINGQWLPRAYMIQVR